MSSSRAIHPKDAIKPEQVISSQALQAGQLLLEHQIQPSGECEISGGLTQHLLVFELGHVDRQVFRMGGQEYDDSLGQGDLLLIPACTSFFGACEMIDEVLALSIDPDFLQQMALEIGCPHPERLELLSGFKIRDRQLQSIFQFIQTEIQQTKWGNQLYLDSLTNLLAIHLLRNYASRPLALRSPEEGLSKFRLNRVLEYINAHLVQDIQLADLAQAANLSQCYFASCFKQSLGIAPWQYVVEQRIERAKKLLKQSNDLITDIALQCGFNSQSHFTQQFRKHTGVTPKTYREQK
ncbi:helix-turn-helix transcriptional regulator [Oculatella sp. FACHB-28]|uniref:helix-turn-helix domain-containing protein n=1 Tax=Oculatella sp. FACHB-28 TaxID=2692845 RepID=UPI0016827F96|nr:AraC family transcriptional regulator [Oculatella sp. FACHB-28]MBD2054749.1 helix-turn-helix transcriptional regulator [Oculatella sp. FACHB-28]